MKFNLSNCVLLQPTYQNLLSHSIENFDLIMEQQENKANKDYIFGLMDRVLAECSYHGLVKQVETICCEYFNCERATLVLIHRFDKYMYRVEKVEDTNPTALHRGGYDLNRKVWELNKGFAGFIGMTGKAMIIPEVSSDHRYMSDLDDPNFKKGISKDARELLGMPIHSRTDLHPNSNEGSSSENHIARAILMLFNKKKKKDMILP